MRVAIVGGTGLIGRALAAALAARGHEAIVLTRRPERTPVKPPLAGVRRWDPGAGGGPGAEHSIFGGAAPNPFEGVDAVVNLAGEPIAGGRWTRERKKRIRDSRVDGTRRIVEALSALDPRPRLLVAGSAVGYYGSRGDAVLRENEQPGGDFLAGVCRDLEREAAAAGTAGARVVTIRTAVVLAATGGALPPMVRPFRLGLGARIGSGRQWFPWIHVTDIAALIVHCIETDAVSGPVNAVSPGIVTNADFTQTLARALGRRALFAAPPWVLRLALGEMAGVLTASIRAVPEVALAHGFEFRYRDLEGALADCLHA